MNETKPVVMVVEDEQEARRVRVETLQDKQCTVIDVASSDEALRELRAAPAVDLVLTDINLSGGRSGDDKSGIALARFIKRTYQDLPVAGYSAHFFDEQMSEDRILFDRLIGKGTMLDYDRAQEMWEWCRDRALEHRRARRSTAFQVHEELKERFAGSRTAVEMLRELTPGGDQIHSVDRALRDAGYRLRLVEAEGLAKPLLVWLLALEDGGVEAEVYGHPELYSSGADEEEAVASLVELMALLREGVDDETYEMAESASRLAQFLRTSVAEGIDRSS